MHLAHAFGLGAGAGHLTAAGKRLQGACEVAARGRGERLVSVIEGHLSRQTRAQN